MTQKNRRPNIVIIIADQMNIDAISAYKDYYTHPAWGSHWLDTPNIDRLINKGVSFLESHSTSPCCCPARAAIFTGRASIETGVTYNGLGIDKKIPNMGEWFEQNRCYDRVYCGKWHAGGKWSYPEISGPKKIPGFDILPVANWGRGDFVDYQVSSGVEAYIRNHDETTPFIIVAGLINPHDICYWTSKFCGDIAIPATDILNLKNELPDLPPNFTYCFDEPEEFGREKKMFEKDFTEARWKNYMYDYYRMVEKLDGDVGRILDAVDSRNDNTIIFFTSDHGEGLGRHRRVAKWSPYDQSAKVPLIISYPGIIKENIIDIEHLVSGVDIMATVCDYAGIPQVPNARGLSLRPLIDIDSNGVDYWRDNIFIEFKFTGRIVRSQQYKYIKYYQYSGDIDKPFIRKSDHCASVFEPGHGDDYIEDAVKILFDMKNDPWETCNLYNVPEYADIMKEHEKLLEQWEDCLIPGEHYER